MHKVDIAIIGGGLVGASLAVALQAEAKQRGWRLCLIEPFTPGAGYQPSYDARSTALSFGSRQIYERLGLWTQIGQRAEPIKQIHVSDRGRFAAARLCAEDEGVPALGYVVENAWLGECLWQALDPEVVQWLSPAQVVRMQPLAEGYRLSLDQGDEIDCALAIMAEGGRSGLREQLGIQVLNSPYGQSALIANISCEHPHQGHAFERFTEEGPMAMLPLEGQRCALVWTRASLEAERLLGLDDAAFLAELQQAFGYRLGRLLKVGARHLYPLALNAAQEQVRRHLVVLGNAAHSLHPIAGQGYNLSLRDTWVLAETLLQAEAPLGDLATLQRYLASQQTDQSLTVGFSDQVTRLFSTGQPLLAAGRNLGLLGLDMLPPAKRWFARQAMGLGTRAEP